MSDVGFTSVFLHSMCTFSVLLVSVPAIHVCSAHMNEDHRINQGEMSRDELALIEYLAGYRDLRKIYLVQFTFIFDSVIT